MLVFVITLKEDANVLMGIQVKHVKGSQYVGFQMILVVEMDDVCLLRRFHRWVIFFNLIYYLKLTVNRFYQKYRIMDIQLLLMKVLVSRILIGMQILSLDVFVIGDTLEQIVHKVNVEYNFIINSFSYYFQP